MNIRRIGVTSNVETGVVGTNIHAYKPEIFLMGSKSQAPAVNSGGRNSRGANYNITLSDGRLVKVAARTIDEMRPRPVKDHVYRANIRLVETVYERGTSRLKASEMYRVQAVSAAEEEAFLTELEGQKSELYYNSGVMPQMVTQDGEVITLAAMAEADPVS